MLSLTVKDEADLCSLPDGYSDCLQFKSNLVKEDVPGVCIWLFPQTDGSNTASTWDSDRLHCLQGQRSASPKHKLVCVASHTVRLQNRAFQVSDLIPVEKQLPACTGRNYHTNF